jgi:enoyl-CoA hydratase/carnithine racemase
LVAVARNVGRKRALEMAFSGEPIDAHTAMEWGLLNAVVPIDQLEAATLELLTRCTHGSALSKAIGKRGFYTQVDLEQPKAYAHAIEVMAASSQTHDAQEGMSAFLEHRRPRYEHR